MKAKGCKFLDYDENKYTKDCSISGLSNDHAAWERKTFGLQLCQFCSKRGRINSADSCTTQSKAQCSDYEEFAHDVIFRSEV